MRLKGFTLAEVLITLMIIGIVAALTIPSVISNYQQQEFKTGLKKAVSVLNEAIQTNIAQDGETPYENADLFSYLQRHMSITATKILRLDYTGKSIRYRQKQGNRYSYTAITPSISMENKIFYTTDGMRYEISSFAVYDDSAGESMSKCRTLSDYTYSTTNPSRFEVCPPSKRKYILHETGYDAGESKQKRVNGVLQGVYSGWCGSKGLLNNANNTSTTPCIITVDINADKKPNYSYDLDSKIEKSYHGGYGSYIYRNPPDYIYPSPSDKKLSDIFTIMITDEKAIPFGVVAQRAMYSK